MIYHFEIFLKLILYNIFLKQKYYHWSIMGVSSISLYFVLEEYYLYISNAIS